MINQWIDRLLRSSEDTERSRGARPLVWGPAAEDPGSLASAIDAPDMLQAELERARRYERDVSIAVLTVEPLGSGESRENGSAAPAGARGTSGPPQVVSLLAAAGLRESLRQSDVLCYQATENRFVLALAESSAHEARRAIARVAGTFRERLELDIRFGVACFPADALTLAGLVERAADGTSRLEEEAVRSGGMGIVAHGLPFADPQETEARANGNGKAPPSASGPSTNGDGSAAGRAAPAKGGPDGVTAGEAALANRSGRVDVVRAERRVGPDRGVSSDA